MTDKGRSDNGFIWNPNICDRECDKSCNVEEYLDYTNCKCRKRQTDKIVKRCDENIDGNKMVFKTILYDHRKVCKSCMLYIVLSIIAFIIIISISSMCLYFYLHKIKNCFNKLLN